MQEIFENIIEKFTNIRRVVKNDEDLEWNRAEYKCKQIVEQAIEEYNNGWIPCSERLPDDFMSMKYLTTVKGHFYPEINYYCVANHKWFSSEKTTKEVNVIAWQPLPEPYQPKGSK